MKKRNCLTKEQKEFLIDICKKYRAKEVSEIFYKKYGIKKSVGTINLFRHNNKITCKCYPAIQTKEQKDFLKTILVYNDNEESAKKFKKKFGFDINKRVLTNFRYKYKIERKYDIQKEKLRKPLYKEIVNNNGIPTIRIGTRKYQYKTRYLWEQYHGIKIPKEYDVIFLDNNKNNYDVNNLALVKTNVRLCLANQGIKQCNRDIIKTTNLLLKLNKKIKSKIEVY